MDYELIMMVLGIHVILELVYRESPRPSIITRNLVLTSLRNPIIPAYRRPSLLLLKN